MKSKRIIRTALSALIAGSMCLTVLPAQAANDHPNLLIGDADRDGVIDIDDVTAIQRRLAEMITFDEQTETMAKTDFSSDRLSINDASIIQMHLAEYDTPEAREVGHAAYVYTDGGYTKALSYYDNYLSNMLDKLQFSGVGYVTRNGRVLAQKTCGMADSYENKPMKPDTLFPVASVSKQVCAAAVLMLQDQGKLNIKDKIINYFPDYTLGKKINITQLLSMRSGIRDFLNYDGSSLYEGHNYPMWEYQLTGDKDSDIQSILDWLFTQPLKFRAGAGHNYSSSNYLLLALIIEQVTGMSYHDFVRKNIFQPLGMTHTSFLGECNDFSDWAERLDGPYHIQEERAISYLIGGGDIVSDALDMNKWMTALSENKLLSAESYNEMITPWAVNYAFGIRIDKNTDTKGGLYHDGIIYTYHSAVYMLPSEHLNIFVTTNNRDQTDYQNQQPDVIAANIAKKITVTEKNNG